VPLEPSGNRRPRGMVTLDRIRLRGLLKEKPCDLQGFSHSGQRRGRARLHHLCITSVTARGERGHMDELASPPDPLVEPNRWRPILTTSSSERRLLTDGSGRAERRTSHYSAGQAGRVGPPGAPNSSSRTRLVTISRAFADVRVSVPAPDASEAPCLGYE
jgi:hypothetical protein